MFGIGSLRAAAIAAMAVMLFCVTSFVMGYRYRGAQFDADLAALKSQAELDNRIKNDAIAALAREAAEAEDRAEAVVQGLEAKRLAAIESARITTPSPSVSPQDIAAINRMIAEASK